MTLLQRLTTNARLASLALWAVACGGGSDANVFNLAGKPCVNLPNGMRKIHTTEEYLEVGALVEMLEVARQLVRLARD